MRTVPPPDRVFFLKGSTHSRGNSLLADTQMTRRLDLTLGYEVSSPFFKEADPQHRLVHLLQNRHFDLTHIAPPYSQFCEGISGSPG